MGYNYYGLPVSAPEPGVTPTVALTKETSSCKDSCYDGNNTKPLNTTAPDHGEPTQEKPNDYYSPDKRPDNKTKNDADAPDCYHGKFHPCCDTSCLDHLAMQEYEMSAAASPAPNSQPNTYSGATDHKPCSRHSLSAINRYGATLQALGCICRAFIALGQETCCKFREQCSRKSSTRSLRRTSLDSCGSNGSVTKHQAAPNHLRLRRGSREMSVKKRSADACAVSFCSKDKPAKCSKPCYSDSKPAEEPCPKSNCAASCCTDDKAVKETPTKNKCSCSCCSEDAPATAPSVKTNCAKFCNPLGKPVKLLAAQTGRLDPCCSKTPRVEESPPKVGYPGSCCPGDQRVKDSDAKGIYTDSCCSKARPLVELPTTECAGSCCGKAKNMITKEPSKVASSGPCYKPLKQGILKTPKTSCADLRCTEQQPVSSKGSCTNTCCSSAIPNPDLEIKEALIQAITNIEN